MMAIMKLLEFVGSSLEDLSRLLTKSAGGVLASFRSSTYPRGYASGLHSLRPCWTAFLNSLRRI
jgi:hypothetical protein